jgi:hypothetical protein
MKQFLSCKEKFLEFILQNPNSVFIIQPAVGLHQLKVVPHVHLLWQWYILEKGLLNKRMVQLHIYISKVERAYEHSWSGAIWCCRWPQTKIF